MRIKPFVEQEKNYVEVHKILFDNVMPKISPAAWKVLSLVVRKTIGWQKEVDILAQSQIVKGTGIKSRTTISRAIAQLVELGILNAYHGQRMPDGKMEATAYAVNKDYEISTFKPCPEIEQGTNYWTDNIPNNNRSITSTKYLGIQNMKPATGEDLEKAYDEDLERMQGAAVLVAVEVTQ